MRKTFQQIQYAAIVQYESPLTEGNPIVGIFYKQSWELMYHQQGERKTIKVTPSQTCEVIQDCLGVLLQEYMHHHADLTTEKT